MYDSAEEVDDPELLPTEPRTTEQKLARLYRIAASRDTQNIEEETEES